MGILEWASVAVTMGSFISAAILLLVCLRCTSILKSRKSKHEASVNITDEESALVEYLNDPSPQPQEVENSNGLIVHPGKIPVDVKVNMDSSSKATEPATKKSEQIDGPPNYKPQQSEGTSSFQPEQLDEPVTNNPQQLDGYTSFQPEQLDEPGTNKPHKIDGHSTFQPEQLDGISTDQFNQLDVTSTGEFGQRDSITSLYGDPAPPICGAVDFCRQSYGYISPNSHLRQSCTKSRELISENYNTPRSEVFYDAQSSLSGLGTIELWRREIENMYTFNSDQSPIQGGRHSVLSKSYDASSEDSYNTAIESSSAGEESEKRAVCKTPTKKRLLSRKCRSMQRIPSLHKHTHKNVYTFIGNSDIHVPGEITDSLHFPKPSGSEIHSYSEFKETDEDSLQQATMRDPNNHPKPIARLHRRGVYGGSLKDKVRQGCFKSKAYTLSHNIMETDNCRSKDDAFFARPGSVSRADLCPAPRARSHPNIFLRSTSQESRGTPHPEKQMRFPSLTVWCPPSSTGLHFTMDVRSGRKENPKPCSSPPTVEYVNFKGNIKR